MGELVDERDLGMPREQAVDVHLLELTAAVDDQLARQDLQVADLLDGAPPAVGLDEADDDIGATVVPAATLVEHRERLADAGRGAEIDPKVASGHIATSRRRRGE